MKRLKLILAILGFGGALALGCATTATSPNYVPPVQTPIGTPSPQILVPGP